MVVLSESYLQSPEKHAIELALMFGIAPKTFPMPNLEVEIMLKLEYENDNMELNFLEATIRNN